MCVCAHRRTKKVEIFQLSSPAFFTLVIAWFWLFRDRLTSQRIFLQACAQNWGMETSLNTVLFCCAETNMFVCCFFGLIPLFIFVSQCLFILYVFLEREGEGEGERERERERGRERDNKSDSYRSAATDL